MNKYNYFLGDLWGDSWLAIASKPRIQWDCHKAMTHYKCMECGSVARSQECQHHNAAGDKWPRSWWMLVSWRGGTWRPPRRGWLLCDAVTYWATFGHTRQSALHCSIQQHCPPKQDFIYRTKCILQYPRFSNSNSLTLDLYRPSHCSNFIYEDL